MRAYLMTATDRKEVKIEIPTDLIYQLGAMWEHAVWKSMDMSIGKWPNNWDERYHTNLPTHHRISGECGMDLTANSNDEEGVLYLENWGQSLVDESEHETADELDGETDEELDGELENESDDGQEDFNPSVSSYYNEQGMQKELQSEFLELLFKLSLSFCTQPYLDGQPGSTLLVYFAGI
jgi:hypothetical protein